MMWFRNFSLFAVIFFLAAGSRSGAQESFKELVGPVSVGPVAAGPTKVPFLTWGGDVATFLANGDLKTKPGSTYSKLGLDMQLVKGDDFIGQVRDYVSGKTPFLRGTFHMMGLASEVIGSDPRTKPVVILQLSWSAGDHIVARKNVRTLNDLKGKKIACQKGGPHVGLLYDSLAAAKLTKEDVTIVWVDDLTGEKGAAEAFRKDTSIDACCVITPDLIGLTSGFDSVGSGAEGTVEGAHMVNSTQQMSRSIADVYAVRRDWFDANKEWVEKFVAGYLKGTEELVAMRKSFQDSNKMSDAYKEILTLSQRTFGADVLPTLDVDAHGLLMDCTFVGLPGQIAFFRDSGNLSGFENKMSEALDLATGWGYAKNRFGFDPNDFDYKKIAERAGVQYVEPTKSERFSNSAESTEMFLGENLDANTIVSFTINFEPNVQEFSADRYGAEFQRAIKAASTFGNAKVVIRGHSDPTKTLIDLVQSGMEKKLLRQTGSSGNFKYFYEGKELDLSNTASVVELIKAGKFSGGKADPLVTMQAALNLSQKRAESVRDAVVKFAKAEKANLDLSQIVPVGAGVSEPVIAKPKNLDEAKENMRVEFRIVRVEAEAITPSEFDF
ncbi:MAG: ABC transporter substrate-binding protein [Pirellula sp.]|jgi:ABC-type nitrate/sulfonate/bicarbonate transport system substrate-binding protein/outer membrane protein OmpA-like peptidoglycan-associated protein